MVTINTTTDNISLTGTNLYHLLTTNISPRKSFSDMLNTTSYSAMSPSHRQSHHMLNPVTLLSLSSKDNLSDMLTTAATTITFSSSTNDISDVLPATTINTTTTLAYPELEPIPFTSKVVLVVLYTFTTIAAVVGNSLAIIVFAQGKRSKTDLRPFLINLAIADLIVAIFCIPFTFAYQITNHWVFSKPMCHIVQFCQVVSVTASVCTNTCIGIDRLIAVKCPLRKRVTSSRSKVVIAFVWILAWCMGVFPLIMGNTRESDGKIICEEEWPDRQSQLAYSFFVVIVTYFLPVTILTVTYSMICHQLWNRSIPGHSDDLRDAHQLKSKRKVVKMLSTVVLLFGVCWLPLHLFFIIISFNLNVFGDAANEIYFGVHWLSMANSFVNPVIYGFMNDNFRADLRNLCQTCLCRKVQRGIINRSPAMRWRMGHDVHDSYSPDPHQQVLTTATLLRHDMELKAATKPMLWQNGRAKTSLGFEATVRSNPRNKNERSKNSIWRPSVREVKNHRNERKARYGLVQNGGGRRDGDGVSSTCNGCDPSTIDRVKNGGNQHFRGDGLS